MEEEASYEEKVVVVEGTGRWSKNHKLDDDY